MSHRLILPTLCLVSGLMAGCGGSSDSKGSVSGVIFDVNGNPVRGASVRGIDQFDSVTLSNSNGAYILNTVQGRLSRITAQLTVNGVRYFGQNMTPVYKNEQSKSVNITVVNDQNLASINGFISDRAGNVVSGAQVFAVAGNGLSSTNVYSMDDGSYTLDGLLPGVVYTLSASARGFDSDTLTATLASQESRPLNFNLSTPSNSAVPAPTNFLATAYTSPAEATRSRDQANAIENMKRILHPDWAFRHRAATQTRTTPGGNLTEVDLTWNPITNASLFGFGIYRRAGTGIPNTAIDYLRDPLASIYADLDATLQVGNSYTYDVTSLNNLFGQGGSESAPTATSTATIVGDLNLNGLDTQSVTFFWYAAQGASTYSIYLFDTYPNIGVSSIWNSDTAGLTITGTSATYSGPSLVSGRTYYYLVLGKTSDGSGVTFSRVGSFVKF